MIINRFQSRSNHALVEAYISKVRLFPVFLERQAFIIIYISIYTLPYLWLTGYSNSSCLLKTEIQNAVTVISIYFDIRLLYILDIWTCLLCSELFAILLVQNPLVVFKNAIINQIEFITFCDLVTGTVVSINIHSRCLPPCQWPFVCSVIVL